MHSCDTMADTKQNCTDLQQPLLNTPSTPAAPWMVWPHDALHCSSGSVSKLWYEWRIQWTSWHTFPRLSVMLTTTAPRLGSLPGENHRLKLPRSSVLVPLFWPHQPCRRRVVLMRWCTCWCHPGGPTKVILMEWDRRWWRNNLEKDKILYDYFWWNTAWRK